MTYEERVKVVVAHLKKTVLLCQEHEMIPDDKEQHDSECVPRAIGLTASVMLTLFDEGRLEEMAAIAGSAVALERITRQGQPVVMGDDPEGTVH